MGLVIFAEVASKGWALPYVAASFVGDFLVAVGSAPFDRGFRYPGAVGGTGLLSDPLTCCVSAVLPIGFGVLILSRTRWVEWRSLSASELQVNTGFE